MCRRTGCSFLCLCSAVLVLQAGTVVASDWPTYRHDFARSGVSEDKLQPELRLQWKYVSPHRPRPAWPEPGRELHRIAFDYAFDVTAAKGVVYFGSSADHKVYALRLATGEEIWSFFTEGPVRFAPAVYKGRVYVASDDGMLYCLSAADGRPVWTFQGGPRKERVFGNEQMISRWPLRSGVAVEDGVVYFTAGMWPSEGVYLYALSAKDGTVIWKNGKSGERYVRQPHPGSYALTGVAPQGYILANRDHILVPTGRNVPASYDRKSGELLHYRSAPPSWGNRWGGVWNFVVDDLLVGWRNHHVPDGDVNVGECQPHKEDGLMTFEAKTVTGKRDLIGKFRAVVKDDTLYASGSGTVTAYDFRAWKKGVGLKKCMKWETEHGRAYSLVMAGDTLLVGGRGTVSAIGAEKGEKLWEKRVNGQGRSLAVADGRVLVSTTEGEIYCFGPEPVVTPPTLPRKAAVEKLADNLSGAEAKACTERVLQATGKTVGHCLVIGLGDGRLLHHLAAESALTIYCVEPSSEDVEQARRSLDEQGLYGVRVNIHHGSLTEIRYPDYFADLIVLNGAKKSDLRTIPAGELYRLLHPGGGRAYVAGRREAWGPFSQAAILSWLEEGGVPQDEITIPRDAVLVTRKKLPKSGAWTHQYANAARSDASADKLAKLPLKLLWFGRPGPATLISRHWQGPSPLSVNGRMFIIGQFHISAVDAYNGRQLWRRKFQKAGRWPVRKRGGNFAADGDSVYFATDKECLRLNAETGETAKIYQIPPPSGGEGSSAKPGIWGYLAIMERHILGSSGNETAARYAFALDKESGKPAWTYVAQGAIGTGAIAADDTSVCLIDRPEKADAAKRRGEEPATVWRLVCLDLDTGKLKWETSEDIQNRNLLSLSEGIAVATSGSGITACSADTGRKLYSRRVGIRGVPVIVNGTIYAEPRAYDLRTGKERTRKSPLTGEDIGWDFRRSYGCGTIAGSPHLLTFRSGVLGFCDLESDTGVHNFPGVRAGCFINAIVAGGLVLMSPGDAGCSCSYNFQTTLALAPADARGRWSIFCDSLPGGEVRTAKLNLGAPADYRGDDGTMWLCAPRPETTRGRRGFSRPFRFEFHEGLTSTQYNNSDIQAPGKSWLYSTGLRGLKRAELDLSVRSPGITFWKTGAAPTTDGKLDDPAWDGYQTMTVGKEKGKVMLRYDGEQLYVAYRGTPLEAAGDKPVFDLYFSNPPGDLGFSSSYLHLGVSSTGKQYTGLWKWVSPFPAYDIPKVEVTIDGVADDWRGKGFKITSLPGKGGKMRKADDFDPSFTVGWNEDGVVILGEISDNIIIEDSNPRSLWKGDSVELFMTSEVGSPEKYQVILGTGADPNHPELRYRFYDFRKAKRREKLSLEAVGKKTDDGYVLEVLLPWKNLQIEPKEGMEVGLQAFANDCDGKDTRSVFRCMWNPLEHPKNDHRLAFQPLCLKTEPSPPVRFKRSEKPGADDLFTAEKPYPFPLTFLALGAKGEDSEYPAKWSGAVHADGKELTAEISVPWKTLADAGFARDGLIVNLDSRGVLTKPPGRRGGKFHVAVSAPESSARPRELTVRLHFAEPDDVGEGDRVFDVKLQGKTVLHGFDVLKATGGKNRPVIRGFKGITVSKGLVLELVPKKGKITASSAPIMNGIEIMP